MDPDEADGISAEATAGDAPVESPSEAAPEVTAVSFEEAFAEAKAEIEAAPPTEGASATADGTTPAGEAAAQPPADAAREPTSPVTPEAKTPAQIREEARQELLSEQREAKLWHDRYVDNLTEQAVDPDAFNRRLIAEDGLATFMREYARMHPEVTLENPDPGPRQPTPDEVRDEVRQAYNEGLQAILTDVAARSGLDITAIPGVAEGKLGTAIDSLISKGVEAGVARELPKALAKEREAIRLELQAQYANKTIVTPREIGGSPVAAVKAGSGPITFREAAELARQELDAAS